MKVKFWGCRGSIPTPLSSPNLKSRIAAILQRITPADLESAESREAFMARLPPYLFGLVGGNTTCLEVRSDDNQLVIVDAGSGIRELGLALEGERRGPQRYDILMTHFHNDHRQIVKDRASGYAPKENGDFEISMTTLDMIGDGGIFTTINDIKKWDDAFYASEVLSRSFWEEMTRQGVLNNGEAIDYASGLDIST